MALFATQILTLPTGEDIRLFSPDPARDGQRLIDYARAAFAEHRYLLFTAEEFDLSIEQESAWIAAHNDSPTSILIAAEYDGEVIGVSDITGGATQKVAHKGEFGISLRAAWTGGGIGSAIMREIIAWAEDNPVLEKLTLSVFSDNDGARRLYEKFGFVHEGRRIRNLKNGDGDYNDEILMGRFV